MIGNIADAVTKYGQAAGLPKIGGASDDVGGMSFGDMLRQATNSVTETQKRAEEVGQQAAVGKANMVDVMTAINNAEVTLQTVVSIRDRLVQAIQDVMRTAV
ncbi:MAG TPA: flagellar hook-basal body complex protein FliE [Alphaproteobacteria bacterium]|nr:flagellar hook-basal body complex protein FliE [Rhodospirillaceae bacterium]HRJ11920.1 flagellar hook-basal body complex protein FliE [Alphaproteobacteria bacterium]